MAYYACSDIHGHLSIYNQIKQFIKPEDTVFFLGDASDRGPEPWKTIKSIYKDRQFIYLKGNHEDMLVRAARVYLKYDYLDHDYYLLGQNGGYETFAQWQLEDFKVDWINGLENLPLRAEYVNKDGVTILMSHAGYTPWINTEATPPRDLLWDRLHFFDRWIDCPENTLILHGHTPADKIYKELVKVKEFYGREEEIKPWKSGAYYYCGGKKICLDNRTYLTKQATLLNLDTFEEHIFKEKQYEVYY